jgi:hypothetical protein
MYVQQVHFIHGAHTAWLIVRFGAWQETHDTGYYRNIVATPFATFKISARDSHKGRIMQETPLIATQIL